MANEPGTGWSTGKLFPVAARTLAGWMRRAGFLSDAGIRNQRARYGVGHQLRHVTQLMPGKRLVRLVSLFR